MIQALPATHLLVASVVLSPLLLLTALAIYGAL